MVEGFKNTEVGIIPNEWGLKRFVEVTKVITCGLAATPKYVNSTIGKPFLSAQNVQNGKVVYNKFSYIPIQLFEQITKHNPPKKGDLLYTRVGAGIGEAGVIEKDFEFAIYVSLTLIKPDEKFLNNHYLLHLLNSPKFKFFAKNGQFAGAGVQNLNVNIVREFLIPLPTISEQTAIANALNDADELITQLEKLIAKKKAMKQGAMQELLKPKEKWIENTLGEVATLKARIGWQGLTTAEYRKTGNFYLITGTEFKNGFIDWDRCNYVDENRYIQDRNIQVKNHDILVTKDGTIGKVALIKSVPKPATLNSGVFVIRPIKDSFDPEFFYYLLLSDVFQIFLSQLSAGSTIIHLYQKDFVTFKFFTPMSLDEQKKIAKVLSDMDNDILKLEDKLEKQKQLKQGMMQSLLTGKIRLV
jgi:type I restriction enzyme, S subunit